MRSVILATAWLLLVPVTIPATPAPVPRLIDADGPRHGARTLELREEWRVGGADGDLLFGRITDVERHADGSVWVLDNQLCHVVVLGPDGEHLRDVGREGDGPGELRQPMGLVFLPGDVVGVGMGFPGRLVTLERDGAPRGAHHPVGAPAEGNVGVMLSIDHVDGVLAASGGSLVFEGPDDSHNRRFLAVADGDLDTYHRILERETPLDPTGYRYDEAADYYCDGAWALAPGGRIHAALARDAYEISVVDTRGDLLRVFGRDLAPRRRTAAEKADVRPNIHLGDDPRGRDWAICDHDEAVSRIVYNPDDGTIWVLTPHGTHDQPEGILETWDVFAATGEFLEQVRVPLGREMREGTCYLVGGGRLVAVKGSGSAHHAADGADADAAEVEPLEVICYALRSR